MYIKTNSRPETETVLKLCVCNQKFPMVLYLKTNIFHEGCTHF
uniref:Uncharacterized protein n=1 Tax=Lepeophtheirus salmonis TaxID=72036 RepID=A0A0K2UK73_LEPSM